MPMFYHGWMRRRVSSGLLIGGVVFAAAVILRAETSFTWHLPRGFPPPRVPAANPTTVEKVALGRYLFYDHRLSANERQSCASCHEQKRAFTDGRARAVGSTGVEHPRSSMSLVNLAYASALTWANPEITTLEAQALVPMFGGHPVEMGWTQPGSELVTRLGAVPIYQQLFAAAYPGDRNPITVEHVAAALASFERTIISGRSSYDRYKYERDENAISESAKRGERLFVRHDLGCAHCHRGFSFTNAIDFDGRRSSQPEFHNIGLTDDTTRFKTPTLRNIAVTAPYMHDGSMPTLEAVIDHYASGGKRTATKSPDVRGFTLTRSERADLVAFLETLTDTALLTDPALADPWPTAPRGSRQAVPARDALSSPWAARCCR